MLNNLHIKNFRILEDLEIPKLGRVNLIVGKNNSGKSTVLEALRIYASKAHPRLLSEILAAHDESINTNITSENDNPESDWLGLKHLFPNRSFPSDDNTSISIHSEGKPLIQIEHAFYYIKSEESEDLLGDKIQNRSRVQVSKVGSSDIAEPLTSALKVTLGDSSRSAWIDLDSPRRETVNYAARWRVLDDIPTTSHSYISTEFLTSEDLAGLWDLILLLPDNKIVLKALQIIDPEVEGLAFIKTPEYDRFLRNRSRYSRMGVVKLSSLDFPVPLNSMGDGMSRILQLILSVFPAKNGILLIDEFENGLHFSVQEEVWRIIFKLAKELNIQVFATTHSSDCIDSFTKIAVESPEEGVLLKVSKSRQSSDNGKVIATVYDESELKTITASDLEVR